MLISKFIFFAGFFYSVTLALLLLLDERNRIRYQTFDSFQCRAARLENNRFATSTHLRG